MESIWNNYFEPQRPRLFPAAVREPVPITRPTVKCSPKLVSVPVHFASSDRRRSDAVAKIQKALRGFLTRKSMKRIIAAKREVDEIDAAISLPETTEKIRRDPKERLRLNEALMSSLLKLDSVRSVVPGVRDCRKAVIKKAIALQERVDGIAAANVAGAPSTEESENEEPETLEKEEEEEEEEDDEPTPNSSDPQKHRDDDENEALESSKKSEDSSQSESSAAREKSGGGGGGERRRSEDLMERMLEDNERLMGIMAELCEKSSAQTRLLNSLSHRVEQLERAVLCEKLRKKKKQRRGCDAKNNSCGNRSL